MMQLLKCSWQRAWTELGTEAPRDLFERLVACYDESHRKYHILQHLCECIERLEPALDWAEHPGEVEVALWFHDAIYNPKSQDNEYQSALWAKRELEASGLSIECSQRVYSLVMATQHTALPKTPDEHLLVDVDLAILGSRSERFEEYEAQVRQEYRWVPDWLFWHKRKIILREFLSRQPIYNTDQFRTQYEVQAKRNLEKSIQFPG